ncbi:flavin reductase family protein [Streptomyces sp. NPDC050560]|uniref:flavin reductase family protein n=1 Tax=Streptomyces sp. NPDC050560 TaxID=3365630 RepID=UPI003793CB81
MTAPSEAGTSPLAPPDLLRRVFRQQASTVAVITLPGPVGFTATSLTSASAEPPVVSFGVAETSSCWPALAEAPYAGVHLLAEDQRELAETFARHGADRFAPPTRWRPGPQGVPLLDGALAWLVCRITARVPAGNHRVVLAEPVAGDPTSPGRPLLYHQGRYRALDA